MQTLSYPNISTLKPLKINEPVNNGNIYDMVVFCHLRWDFVYQRPQHIISRLAENKKILLIEEPYFRPELQGSKLNIITPNLHVLQPNVHHIEDIEAVLVGFVDKSSACGWFYSAAFMPLLNYFEFDTIVYDCMDELTLFKGAPQKLIEQEHELLNHADIVFTGGKSLYESKIKHHDQVYCFPSSVDRKHFAKALNGLELPSDIKNIQGPIVGYFGVIDERIDLTLLNQVALMKPHISFVMIGPLAKLGEDELPKQPNLHYLGMKSYKELPAYLKAFKIAMMPFALNDATKYISPTKTLEYMAAGKPIISTAIVDVVRDYHDNVNIIATPKEFSLAIDAELEKSKNLLFTHNYSDILEKTSWDATVNQMENILKKYLVHS